MSDLKNKDRIEFLIDLAHYFQAYAALSEQINQAASNKHVDSLTKLTNLRQQTQNKIDQLLKKNPEILAVPFESETDPNIIKVRSHIRELAKRSEKLNEGVLEISTEIRDELKKSIGDMSKGKKVMRGYTVGRDKRARFIETTK